MKHSKQRKDNPKNIKLIEERYDSEDNPPRFSFRFVNQTKFSYDELEKEDRLHLINKLVTLSQLKWKDIRQQFRHGLGCV
jgi:hypothetical protein